MLVLVAHLNSVRLFRWVPDLVGVAGVGIFFALSGFLITRILLAERGADRSLLGFYNRRVARIFPIYYLTLIVLCLVVPGRDLAWAADFSFNFRYLAGSRDYFRAAGGELAASPVAHFWSLCVEEHFYWIWPVVVMLLPTRWASKLLFGLILLTPFIAWGLGSALLQTGYSATEVEGLLSRTTCTQLVALCIGALAAFHESWLLGWRTLGAHSVPRAVLVGLGLIIGSFTLAAGVRIGPAWMHAAAGTALHLGCGGLFIMLLPVERLGSLPLLPQLGKISYGAYIFHLPIYLFLGLLNKGAPAPSWLALSALGLTLLLATLSYLLIERPILHFARSKPAPNRRGFGLAFGVVCTALLFGVSATGFFKDVASVVFAGPGSSALATAAGVGESSTTEGLRIPPEEVEGIILGSSHAEMGISANAFAATTYNCAFTSQDLWYDCEIAAELARRLPNLRRIYFNLSVFSPAYSISGDRSESWREGLYYLGWNISSRQGEDNAGRYRMLLAGSQPLVDRAIGKAQLRDEPLRGWSPQTGTQLDPAGVAAAVARHRGIMERPAEVTARLQDKLIRTIRDCQDRGIECVLLSTPTHALYREHFTAEELAGVRMLVDEVCRETEARYLDYSADPRFPEGYFYDGDHLNRQGAELLSQLIEADCARRSSVLSARRNQRP